MRAFLGLAIGFAILASGCSTYLPSAGTRQDTSVTAEVTVSVSLTSAQAALVKAHYANSGVGYGRGRNNRLPPGIAKNLSRGKSLPPGIAKQYLPGSVLSQLPAAPRGYEYLVAAGKLLLVEIATQVIRDVLLDDLA